MSWNFIIFRCDIYKIGNVLSMFKPLLHMPASTGECYLLIMKCILQGFVKPNSCSYHVLQK